MKRREVAFLILAFVLSVVALAVAHFGGGPGWGSKNFPAAAGSDGVLWQVQTTFLSVGFAGLAIAVQLFAEAPLAIGASRERVLQYIRAGWFVGVGLIANAALAIETLWLPSGGGLLTVALAWSVLTVALLIVSTRRLMQLFGNPSLLDEVVRWSLVDKQSHRLSEASLKYADARKQLEGLTAADWPVGLLTASSVPQRVPVPEVGLVVKGISRRAVQQAIELLGPRATETDAAGHAAADQYEPPWITIDIEPGDRTRLGETAFRFFTQKKLDKATTGQVIGLLQSSIEFEPAGSVTPDEETDREIANLKDAIGTNLRSGALATAERALDLLGHVFRGVWIAEPATLDASRRASYTRRDWLFRSISEVEQDVLLSPRVAGLFVGAAMTRAMEAPRTGSTGYVDECLRSFTQIWCEVLSHGGSEFDSVPLRITTCVQNLTAYAYATGDASEDLQARGTWAMVELVKLAVDAGDPDAARMAAGELDGLFKFDRHGTGRSHVLAGQLVLSGWLDYLTAEKDKRATTDVHLRALVAPHGEWNEIVEARKLAEPGNAPFCRWDWWEMKVTASPHAEWVQLPTFVDRAQLAALASSHGQLPPAHDQETASDYLRFLRLLDESGQSLTTGEAELKRKLDEEIDRWHAAEEGRLAQEPVSEARVELLRRALRETLAERPRLADEIALVEEVPDDADTARPVLGMNLRVPRHYVVERVFNQTYADPQDLGEDIARGFIDGEEKKILAALRLLQDNIQDPTAASIRQQLEAIGGDAEHYVLVTPYGGLDDLREWYSDGFQEALQQVTHIETGVLDSEAILFDRRNTLKSSRKPQEKEGLAPVDGATIALGVFDDISGGGEPQVRIETGEYFVVWPGDDPRVFRFGGAGA